eukprot:TRINITY_DN24987_c0_g1_i2.p1 TRINITY_DN24987_c0_g1~~TRINITY_DN24987_c0_g1_i2.p1  ORF type:complete len:914 (+),score=137.16 TRINITY_DN24987_c0_g1_i2:311-3052(+)
MVLGLQWIVDKITFPSPPSSYSLTSHPELFFVRSPQCSPSQPGVPCMLYAIPQGARALLIHAHSNGCDIGDMRQTLHSLAEGLHVHVMSFEFPGYGLHVGAASMRSIDETARLVLNFLVHDMGVNLAQVVWYGRSIGSGPAIRIAHRITKEHGCQPGGLVLQCGYANFPEVAGHLFGRVAKRLVSPLWRNEANLRELNCPVLLIHGRNDTMIPIEQSKKLWNATVMKDRSNFRICDCGHNNFDFRRCTLTPIQEFLSAVISAPQYPSTTFPMNVRAESRALVHHIGPLRMKLPVYGFRRPELDEWMRQLEKREEKDAAESAGKVPAVAEPQPPPSTDGGKKGKAENAENLPPPIPDYCELPPIEDVAEALLDPRGMVRTCALRVGRFLDRLQRQLDRVENLQDKPLEQVVELVESEFWSCDPLLCLWEEIQLPRGDRLRLRLGPFSIDNLGVRSFDAELGPGSSSGGDNVLRVPLWIFSPSAAHFRCLAEWSLLHSSRLEQTLPASSKPPSSGACCVPCRRSRAKQKSGQAGPKVNDSPTRGVLATSLAAHFVNWVMVKTKEVKAIFSRFVELYQNPDEMLQRLSKERVAVGPALEPKELPSELLEETTITSATDLPPTEGDSPPVREEGAKRAAERASAAAPRSGGTNVDLAKQGAPWPPLFLSLSARSGLMEASSTPTPLLLEYYTSLWTRQDDSDPPVTPSFQAVSQLPSQTSDANVDWVAANLLRHYDATLGCETGACMEGGDPSRAELREAGAGLSKAMRTFGGTEYRKRRESEERRKLRPAPRLPQQPTAPAEAISGEPESLQCSSEGSGANKHSSRHGHLKTPAKPELQDVPTESTTTEAQLNGAVTGSRGDIGAATFAASCGSGGISGAKGTVVAPIPRFGGPSSAVVAGPVPQPGRNMFESASP